MFWGFNLIYNHHYGFGFVQKLGMPVCLLIDIVMLSRKPMINRQFWGMLWPHLTGILINKYALACFNSVSTKNGSFSSNPPVHMKRPPFRSPERPEPQEEILGQSSVLGRLLASHYSQSDCVSSGRWHLVTSGDGATKVGRALVVLFSSSVPSWVFCHHRSKMVQDGP